MSSPVLGLIVLNLRGRFSLFRSRHRSSPYFPSFLSCLGSRASSPSSALLSTHNMQSHVRLLAIGAYPRQKKKAGKTKKNFASRFISTNRVASLPSLLCWFAGRKSVYLRSRTYKLLRHGPQTSHQNKTSSHPILPNSSLLPFQNNFATP
jgi:hypothetical protein